MTYIDGFVIPVPNGNKDAYRDMAERAAAVFKTNGAVQVVEAWGDDVPDGKVTDFRRAVAAEEGETVVFSWITWPDKAARDTGMKKSMEDLGAFMGEAMPFDGKRMIFGGFATIVDR